MNQLIPCPSCSRHVRQAESSCPFCSVALSLAHVPPPLLPRTRLGRAATFAFGATIVGATIVGCGGDSEEGKNKGGASSGGSAGMSNAGTDTGGTHSVTPLYGAPSGGSGIDNTSGSTGVAGTGNSAGSANVAGSSAGPVYGAPAGGTGGFPLYGAAPAD